MAKEAQKVFPQIPVKHWWALRRKFQQSIPGTVTANYLAATLNMKEDSARANIIPPLKQMGIIDEEGKPKDRATKWRDDQQYPHVCNELLLKIYPKDLRDAAPNPTQDKSSASRWFANHTHAGKIAVGKMVACYTVLTEADPTKTPKSKSKESTTRRKPKKKKETIQVETEKKTSGLKRDTENNSKEKLPQICINLQVHISSDASSDQIDQIFASMAKHIYRR